MHARSKMDASLPAVEVKAILLLVRDPDLSRSSSVYSEKRNSSVYELSGGGYY